MLLQNRIDAFKNLIKTSPRRRVIAAADEANDLTVHLCHLLHPLKTQNVSEEPVGAGQQYIARWREPRLGRHAAQRFLIRESSDRQVFRVNRLCAFPVDIGESPDFALLRISRGLDKFRPFLRIPGRAENRVYGYFYAENIVEEEGERCRADR